MARTIVSVTFDDGWADQYEAGLLLAAHGVKATFYVNSSTIGSTGFLTWAQLEVLAAEGHEIGGHGLLHVDLTEQDDHETAGQIEADRTILVERGFPARSFAYPFGAHDPTTERAVRTCGYESGRTAWGLRNISARWDRRPRAGPLPPPNPYAILTACCIDSRTPLSRLTRYVARAERDAGGWLPVVLHRVSEDGRDEPAASIERSTLDAFVGWLAARTSKGTRILTVAEAIAAGRA